MSPQSGRPNAVLLRVCAGTTYPTAYDAFLDGCIASHTMAYGPFFLENRINEANVYVEDNWRVTPTLTLNLGFRYEYVSAPSEKESRLDYGISADDDNYEPRFGLAWTPRPSEGWLQLLTGREVGDSSLRGGYGITHGRIFQSVFSQSGASLRGNPPLALTRVITNSLNISDPTGEHPVFQGLLLGWARSRVVHRPRRTSAKMAGNRALIVPRPRSATLPICLVTAIS